MTEKANLKIMRCPTCGAPLKAENSTDIITCVYCGNSITPVYEASTVAQKEGISGGFSGVLKVEGIKTSSSALAYIEQFFEEYDWEAFAYAQTLSVAEIDKLADSLKVSSADDKNTWFVCFKALYVPFIHKVAGCKQILSCVIEEYKKNNLDAYSKFDAYKRIAAMITAEKNSIAEKLEKISANAARYGASADEVKDMNAGAESIRNLSKIHTYADIECIEDIKAFIEEKNAKIAQKLAAKGIDAEKAYARAKTLIDEQKPVVALNILLELEGYADSAAVVEKLDKYFLIDDVLEINGKLYYFEKESEEGDTYNLHAAVDGVILENALIRNIGKIITNYADILYYIDGNNNLKKYDFSSQVEEQISDSFFFQKAIYVYGRKVFLLRTCNDDDYGVVRDVVLLDLATGKVTVFLEGVRTVLSLTDNKMVYTISGDKDEDGVYQPLTNIINVDTMDIVELGTKKVFIEGFVDEYVVYTQEAPNSYNKNLYVKVLGSNEPEQLIEKNIFKFCDIISNKLFYYVGNSRNKSLINISCDGTGRKEWPLYISKVLFEQGGWLYFVRSAGYNSVLCKSRLDGSNFSIIAADIETFLEIKNGYLYYINDASTLVKVRMDGSNLQELCEDVETVLSVKEDKIIFVSIDDRITTDTYEQTTTKTVKSIYAVDFSGSGKMKLAYNIKVAKQYDENTVYYISEREIQSAGDWKATQMEVLCKADVVTNQIENLLVLQVQQEEKGTSTFAIMMVLMLIAIFLALIGFTSGLPGFGAFGLIGAVISLMIGLGSKMSE